MDIKNPACVVLAGGVALGSYQAGAFEALEAEPTLTVGWIAGSSVGAINGAIIAGSRPEQRVDALRTYWLRNSVWRFPADIPHPWP